MLLFRTQSTCIPEESNGAGPWRCQAFHSLSLSPLPSSTSHLPFLSLTSLSSTTVWVFSTGQEKMTAASTYNLHTPLYFQPKTRLSFLQHQFQGRVPIGSPKVTWSLTEPITDAWGIEFNDQPDLSHIPISLARSVIRRREMQNPARFFFSSSYFT